MSFQLYLFMWPSTPILMTKFASMAYQTPLKIPTFNLLPNIQLKWLELSANGGTSRTLPPGALFGHKDIYAGLTDTTNAFCARIAFPELTYALTGGTVNLYTLGWEARWGVGQAEISWFHVKIVTTLHWREAFDRRERFRSFHWVRWRCESLLEGWGLITLKVGGWEWRHGGSIDR